MHKDIKVRKALAWEILHDMKTIWRSNLSKILKLRYFTAAIETILLYGSETWTLTAYRTGISHSMGATPGCSG